MNRIYHPYTLWEDYLNGMWRKVPTDEESIYLKHAISFTGNDELYGKYMLYAIEFWPNGCEHNLTCIEMNRRAWTGHAAVCIAFECPEYITRSAWGYLTKDQQDRANNKAEIAIKIWEENYAKDTNWNRCIDRRQAPDFMDVRHIREDISLFQRREGQHGNASSGSMGGQEKEKKIRPDVDRLRGAIQTYHATCPTLF